MRRHESLVWKAYISSGAFGVTWGVEHMLRTRPTIDAVSYVLFALSIAMFGFAVREILRNNHRP